MCTQLLLGGHIAYGAVVSAASWKHLSLPPGCAYAGSAGSSLPLEEVPALGVGLSLPHNPFRRAPLQCNAAILQTEQLLE